MQHCFVGCQNIKIGVYLVSYGMTNYSDSYFIIASVLSVFLYVVV